MDAAWVQSALARPWLRPAATSLVALTDDPVTPVRVAHDPGLVLHVLRYTRPTPTPDTFEITPSGLSQPGLCETAAALLELDPSGLPTVSTDSARVTAHVGAGLARLSGLCTPDAAAAVGLLLGTLGRSAKCARKMFPRWRLPAWVTLAVGFLELPLADVVTLGGHHGLLRAIRAAVRAVGGVPIYPEADPELDGQAPFLLEQARMVAPPRAGEVGDADLKLLPRLLRATAKLRQRTGQVLVPDLERQIDQLTAALAKTRAEFDATMKDARLRSLAEYAAGAAHEINTPLAVISTNTQLLRSAEDEPDRLGRYDTIIRQTKRIHEILYGSRQFALPPQPQPAFVSPAAWVADLEAEFAAEAAERQVTLDLPCPRAAARAWADASHLRTILSHLVKNALEAAGPGGWVRVRAEVDFATVRIVVEDGGRGPTAAAVPHLFDPFYSGRSAGRGRGLGLAIAWRLAKQNGGDVSYEPRPNQPARFVVTLPAVPAEMSDRRSA